MFEIWMSAVALSLAFSNLFQLIHIVRRKSADDISLMTFGMLFHGQVWFFVYGIVIKKLPIILQGSIASILLGAILVMTLIYRRK